MRNRFAAAVLLMAVLPQYAKAWNALGHKVVAEIAWRQLTPAQRQSIVDTLRRHPRFDTDFVAKMDDDAAKGDKTTQDHWIFQHAATWPDIIRDDKQRDRPTWHYINLPQYLADSDRVAFANRPPANFSTDYPGNTPREKYNIVQAIQLCQATIRGKAGPDVKAMAYCWLMHLVGDIHQPLHCTALFSVDHLPKGDRGGNKIPLTRGENLHSLWDGLLGRQYYMRNVDKSVAELVDRKRYGDVWKSAAQETDPRAWANESHALCESVAYPDVILQAVRSSAGSEKLTPIELPESYYTAAGERARQQVIMAGIRLGAMLRGLVDGHAAALPVAPPVKAPTPIRQLSPALSIAPAQPAATAFAHWLTTKTGVRHNSGCRWYKASDGRACSANEGKPCKVCGG